MAQTLTAAYRERLQSGALKPDAAQEAGVRALARLEDELNAASEPSFGLSFFKRPKSLRGVYLWGPVGCGK